MRKASAANSRGPPGEVKNQYLDENERVRALGHEIAQDPFLSVGTSPDS